MFYPISLIVPLIPLLPNILFVFYKPVNIPRVKTDFDAKFYICAALEKLGQFGIFLLPIFYECKISEDSELIALSAMAIFIMIYYYCWLRFFTNGREYKYLFIPLAYIPLPMALLPALYFILAAYLFKSVVMLVFAIIFSIGHIYLSNLEYKKVS